MIISKVIITDCKIDVYPINHHSVTKDLHIHAKVPPNICKQLLDIFNNIKYLGYFCDDDEDEFSDDF